MTSNGTALITGASSGLGAAYAERLAARGYDLLLVARRGDAMRERFPAAEVLEADLTRAGDLARVEARLREDASITVLVNNAGVGLVAPFVDADPARLTSMIELNVTALTRLSHAFAARGAGTLINVGSITPLALLQGMAAYNGTKAYVNVFTETLAAELPGLRIQAVLFGAVGTEMWDKSGLPLEHLDAEIVMPIDDAVDAALAGLDAGELVTIPALPEVADWEAHEATRLALTPNLSRREPAARYQVTVRASGSMPSAARPPSTGRTAPLTNEAAGESRCATTSATSEP